jgi:hypothetical protein
MQPALFIEVLCTDHHWAGLYLRNSDKCSLVADGKYGNDMKELGRLGLHMLLIRLGHRAQSVDVQFANVPKQTDLWSCGPRLAASTEHLVQSWSDLVNFSSFRFSAPDFDIGALHKFLNDTLARCQQAGGGFIFPDEIESGNDPIDLDGRDDGAARGPSSLGAQQPVSRQKDDGGRAPCSTLVSQQTLSPRVVGRSPLIPSGARVVDGDAFRRGKQIAAARGVDFDHVVQREHRRAMVPYRNHWKSLCVAVGLYPEDTQLSCKVCRSLYLAVVATAPQAPSPQPLPDCMPLLPLPAPAPASMQGQLVQAGDVDVQLGQLVQVDDKAKCRRGRKPSDAPKFALAEFLQSEPRSSMYEMLPDPGNVPVLCRQCDKIFLAQRTSTPYWIHQHEASVSHRGAGRIAICDVGHAQCPGLHLVSLVCVLLDVINRPGAPNIVGPACFT